MGPSRPGVTAPLELEVQPGRLCVARLPGDAPLPGWLPDAAWYSVTRSGDELSIVCASALVPADVRHQDGWRRLKVRGPLDFALTGILARLAAPLAKAGISIFALSTFDTDYVLVPEASLEAAVACLGRAGMIVHAAH